MFNKASGCVTFHSSFALAASLASSALCSLRLLCKRASRMLVSGVAQNSAQYFSSSNAQSISYTIASSIIIGCQWLWLQRQRTVSSDVPLFYTIFPSFDFPFLLKVFCHYIPVRPRTSFIIHQIICSIYM